MDFISIVIALISPRSRHGTRRDLSDLIRVDLGQKRFPCREAERASRFMRLRRIAPPRYYPIADLCTSLVVS